MIEKLKYEFLDFKIYFLTCFYIKTPKKHNKNFDKLIFNHKTPSNHSKTNTKKINGLCSIFAGMVTEKKTHLFNFYKEDDEIIDISTFL